MSAEKRKRSKNFSDDEKLRFLQILQRKGYVIISKVTAHDLQTNRLKEEAWTQITSDLNASGSILRTTDNLKKLWQKMKTEAKIYKSILCNQSHGIGGPCRKIDPVLEVVAEITKRGSTGKEMVKDCDLVLNNLNTSFAPCDIIEDSVNSCTEDSQEQTLFINVPVDTNHTDETCSLDEVTPNIEVQEHDIKIERLSPETCKHLQRRRPQLNNSKRRTNPRLRFEKDKRDLIALQKKHMIEEHNMRQKQAEIHEKQVDSELLKIVNNL